MVSTIAITIPVYISAQSHRDLYCEALRSIRTPYPYYYIPVINRLDPEFAPLEPPSTAPKEVISLPGRQPQSVAAAWNLGISKGREYGCDYVLVLNQDVVLKKTAIDRLVEFAETNPQGTLWSMSTCPSVEQLQNIESIAAVNLSDLFSAFMVRGSFFDEAGMFDENFVSAYWEDQDMVVRLVLGGKKLLRCPDSLYFHHGSATIRGDPKVDQQNKPTFLKNAFYFQRKWGYGVVANLSDIPQRYFAHPYDEKDKPLSYWRT